MRRVLGLAGLLFALLLKGYAQPTNDNCSGAIAINIPANGVACVTGTTIGATSTTWPSAVCGQTTWTNDVWYTFIATGAENAIIVQPAGSPGVQKVGLSVYTGTCGNLTGNGTYCATTAATNGSDTVIQIGTPGTQYWVEVSALGGDGGFNLCVLSTTPPAAPGISCATATPVCTEAPFILTAAPMGGTANFQPGCFAFPSNQYYWYQFTAGTAGSLAWSVQPLLAQTELDYAVYDITAGCANLAGNEIGCNYHYSGKTSAATGMSDTSTTNCPLASTGAYPSQAAYLEFCPAATLIAGHTYGIFIENYSNNQSGWSFNWTGSTFQMAPTSVFTATPATVCGNSGTVTLTNTSVGASSQTWNFGDGNTSTAANPGTHNYTAAGTYIITLTVNSATGCSSISTQSVLVSPKPVLTVNNPPICSGQPDTLTAVPSIPLGTYSWSPGGATTASVITTLTTNTTYTVTYTSPYGCSVTATNTATVDNNHFTVNAGNDTSVCAYQNVKLFGSVTPTGTYTYQWSPAATLTNANTLTPTASTGGTTIYQLAVTDAARCTYTDTMTVGISGIPIPVQATVTPSVICPGQQVVLNATVKNPTCGPTVACTSNTLSNSVGGGNTIQPGAGTTFPTLLGNYDHSCRNQMLYLGTELTPILMGPCTINAVAFNIQAFNSNEYLESFTINMACTDSTSISRFDNSLTQVYTNADYRPVDNWNTFALSTPFAWDGVSNLIVDICWYDPSTSGNQNNKAQCTNTGFNSYLSSWSNAINLCGTNTVPNAILTLRPNIEFDYCTPSIGSYPIVWTPSTGADAVSNPSIASPTANPVNSTLYTINVGGTGGCGGQDTVRVLVDTSKISTGPDLSICPGSATELRATLTGTPIPGPPVFKWTTLAGAAVGTGDSVSVSPTVNTTYVVTMTGGACTKTDTINVSISGLTVTLVDSNISCKGGSNGKILASANGVSPYTYAWNPAVGSINPDINLAAGNYSVTLTDHNGCSGSATTTLSQPLTSLSAPGSSTNVTCYGGNNGSIIINATGGTGAYTYLWSNSLPPTKTVTGLTQGIYDVTVTDANGCSASSSVSISQPTQITFGNAVIQNVRCLNGSTGAITVSATGGTGAYTYSWSQNNGLNSPTATNLTAGTYVVTVKDAANCTASQSNMVSQPTNGLTFGAFDSTIVTCYGGNNGTLTANPQGGTPPYVYAWSNTQTTQTATGLTMGTYTITVSDDSVCSASATVSLSQPLAIQISAVVVNNSCYGDSNGSITLTITNSVLPDAFIWSNSATTQNLTNLKQGVYMVTVTDHNNCQQKATSIVNQPPVFALSPVVTNISCFGYSTGKIVANPTGGTSPYTYSWSPTGATTDSITNLIAGIYSLTVTDNMGCSVTTTQQVTQPPSGPAFGPATIVNNTCNGGSAGSITVNVSGGVPGYTYSWSQNSQLHISEATNLPAGIYTVTAADANGCTVSQTDTVTAPTAITFGAQTIGNVTCFGLANGSALITPTGGTGNYTYTWNGTAGPNPDSNLVANTYLVVVSDQYSCTATTTVVISQPPALTATPVQQPEPCFGDSVGSLTANAGGGTSPYTYLWSNGETAAVDSLLKSATYTLSVTDNTGCSISVTASVSQPLPLGDTHDSTQVKCTGDKNGTITVYSFGGTGPYDYSVTQDGAIFYTTTDSNITGLDSGKYTIIISDSHGCTITDSTRVLSPVPDYFTLAVTPTSCYGSQYKDGTITITDLTTRNEPYEYSVDSGQLQYIPTFTGLGAGNHVIDAINNFGCTSVLDTTVPQPVQAFTSVMPKDTTLKLGESIQLSSAFVPYPLSAITSYQWVPTVGLSCADCPDPVVSTYSHVNEYTLIITYNNLCTAADSMTILITNNLQVFIPNSFSPNNDGNNDVFEIYGAGVKTVILRVFNRWGEKVFEGTDQFKGWDGTYKGKLQDPAVFTYDAQIDFLDNTHIEKSGTVTLVR